MRVEHVAVYVEDLEGAVRFFREYFGAEANDEYHNPRTGLRTHFLTLPGGQARIELMTRPDMSLQPKDPLRCGLAHLALQLGSREAVERLTARMAADGYEVLSGPRVTGDGYYESQVLGFEGNVFELVE